jgi:hypothetical protein
VRIVVTAILVDLHVDIAAAALSTSPHDTRTHKDTHDDDYYQENDKDVPVMPQPVHVALSCVSCRLYSTTLHHVSINSPDSVVNS